MPAYNAQANPIGTCHECGRLFPFTNAGPSHRDRFRDRLGSSLRALPQERKCLQVLLGRLGHGPLLRAVQLLPFRPGAATKADSCRTEERRGGEAFPCREPFGHCGR